MDERGYVRIVGRLKVTWFIIWDRFNLYSTALCDWSRKNVLTFQPIRCEIKTKHDSLTFSALQAVCFFCFSSHCLHWIVCLALIGRCDYVTQSRNSWSVFRYLAPALLNTIWSFHRMLSCVGEKTSTQQKLNTFYTLILKYRMHR